MEKIIEKPRNPVKRESISGTVMKVVLYEEEARQILLDLDKRLYVESGGNPDDYVPQMIFKITLHEAEQILAALEGPSEEEIAREAINYGEFYWTECKDMDEEEMLSMAYMAGAQWAKNWKGGGE